MARAWSNPAPKTDQAILEQFDDKLRLQVTYDHRFIQALKAAIPADDRAYDPHWRRWTIDARHAEAVLDLLMAHGYSVEDIRHRPKKWASVSWCLGGGGIELITEYFYPSREAALEAKSEIDRSACGGGCSEQHTVELRTVPKAKRFKRWNGFHYRYQPVETCDITQQG